MAGSGFEIRLVQSEAEKYGVYRTRYGVYVEELGWSTSAANPETCTLTDELDRSGNLFAAFQGDEVVGTLRTHHSNEDDLGKYVELYRLRDALRGRACKVAIATMFMVRRPWRLSRVAWSLMTAAFQKACNSGVEMVFADCSPEMAPFYRKLGFTVHPDVFMHPEFGPGLSISMELRNSRFWLGAARNGVVNHDNQNRSNHRHEQAVEI